MLEVAAPGGASYRFEYRKRMDNAWCLQARLSKLAGLP
jgi:hypothetical protein